MRSKNYDTEHERLCKDNLTGYDSLQHIVLETDSISHIVDNRGKSLSTASMHIESNKIYLASLSSIPGLNAMRNYEKEEMVNIYRREEQFRRMRNLSDTGEEV